MGVMRRGCVFGGHESAIKGKKKLSGSDDFFVLILLLPPSDWSTRHKYRQDDGADKRSSEGVLEGAC